MHHKRHFVWTAVGLIGWAIIALWICPVLLEIAHEARVIPTFSTRPLGFFLREWYGIAALLPFVVGAVCGFAYLLRSPRWSSRLVPDARPSDLGAIRILVCGILLTSVLWEDVASTAALPRALADPLGLMHIAYLLPGFEQFASSYGALRVFEWITGLALFFGMIGWRTKIMLPIGALLYLLMGGLLRQYAWFFHTGLIPLYLLSVLSFLPAGDGWSVDRLLRRRRGRAVVPEEPLRQYGWARYAVWTALALPYVAAGLSKIRNGGLLWWDAANFKFILFQSTLRPMEFDFDWSLGLANAPDFVVEALALSAVLGEILYGSVLFSRRARWIVPSVMLVMHIGILFLQNILFFDLILLQVVYFNFRPAIAAAVNSSARLRQALQSLEVSGANTVHAPSRHTARVSTGVDTARSTGTFSGRGIIVALFSVLAMCWLFRIEFYPFTGMQMFSKVRTEPILYERVLAYTTSGEVMRAPIEESIPAMSDSRFRRILEMAFSPDTEPLARSFMHAVVARWNDSAPDDRRIEQVEIQRWAWNYLSEPEDPNYGRLVDRTVFSFEQPDSVEQDIEGDLVECGFRKGARKAVDEYMAENDVKIFLDRVDFSARIAVKP